MTKKGKSQAVKALAQSILYDPRENKKKHELTELDLDLFRHALDMLYVYTIYIYLRMLRESYSRTKQKMKSL